MLHLLPNNNQQFKHFIMAVKPEIIKARLKVLFPKANLSIKRLDALAAKLAPMPVDDADDLAVDAILNQANDFNSFEEIAREDDRIRTLEAKANPSPNPTPAPAPTPAPTPDETPAWAKALIDSNQKMTADLEAIKSGNVLETKKQTASQLFEKSDVLKGLKEELKPRWINRIDVNSETSIEDQIKELESEYSELVQVSADNNQYGGAAGGGFKNDKPDDLIVNEIVDNLNI